MNSINSKANRLSQNPWVAFLPEQFQPYAYLGRFDKPIGVWLLLAPCLWSITLASYPGLPDGEILLLFFMGAFLMRAAGCAYNDLLDKTYDAQVQRTYTRPIASGQLLERQGMLFLAFLLSVSLLILVQFNFFSIALGFTALVFVMLYPLMKRITYWPQAFLGLTFNWGALLGWAVIREELSWVSILLYLAGIFWTLGYDTIYAHQDKEDDLRIGVKSSALKLGKDTPQFLWVFYGFSILCFLGVGILSPLGALYYVAVLACSIHFAWQIYTLDMQDPEDCLNKFKSNKWVGFMMFGGILFSQFI